MSDTIYLMQNDTLPVLYVQVTDQNTELPVDISSATSVVLNFYARGTTTIIASEVGTLLAGTVNSDGSITTTGYTTPGTGGRVSFPTTAAMTASAGSFAGAITVTCAGGGVQTVYNTLRFTVKALLAS